MFLNFTDAVMIALGLVISVFIFLKTGQMLGFVGVVSKRFCLEGSMGYLYTAKMTARLLSQNNVNEEAEENGERFDVFLSHSDSEADREKITKTVLPFLEGQLSLKACFRERDIPPNEPELASLCRAIEKSKRFIIFLSKDFLQDRSREMETNMILESLFDRPSRLEEVLVIKLYDCVMPSHWTDFTVHDWTSSNLHIDDHLLRLVQWVTPRAERSGAMRTAFDVWMVVLPWLLLALFFLIFR